MPHKKISAAANVNLRRKAAYKAQTAHERALREAQDELEAQDAMEEDERAQLSSPLQYNPNKPWDKYEEDNCSETPYANHLPSEETPKLRYGVRHSMHAPRNSVEPICWATPPPQQESFIPPHEQVPTYVQSIIDTLMSENASLCAQIADLMAKMSDLANQLAGKHSQPDKQPNAAPSAQPTTSTSVPRQTNAEPTTEPATVPMETEDASVSQAKKRFSYSEAVKRAGVPASKQAKVAAALRAATKRPSKKPTADSFQLVYVGGLSRKPIRLLKKNLMDMGFNVSAESIANISFLGATTCELLMSPGAATHFKHKIKEFNHPGLRILENFDAAKAADPKASTALKETLQNSYISRIHQIISRPGSSDEVRKFFSALLEKQGLPLPDTSPVVNEDEIPIEPMDESSTSAPIASDQPVPKPEATNSSADDTGDAQGKESVNVEDLSDSAPNTSNE